MADIGISTAVVFLLCWSEFFLAVFLLRPGEQTIASYFASFETINGYAWGPLGAAIVASMIPAILAITVARSLIRVRGHSS
jgi:ABC-type glycerol-3-phosphate transport system permease component